MKQNGSIALFQYWNKLRDGRPAPKRTEIEPAQIKSLLTDTFILERDMRGQAVFRLAGSRLCSTFGRELKSLSFSALWHEKDRNLAERFVASVFGANSVAVIGFEAFSRNGRSALFEMIVLPLDGGIDNPRCLGAMSAGQRPFWLGADPVAEIAIESVRLVDPASEFPLPGGRPTLEVPALSPVELPAGQDDIGQSGSRRIRHLVVHNGGKT